MTSPSIFSHLPEQRDTISTLHFLTEMRTTIVYDNFLIPLNYISICSSVSDRVKKYFYIINSVRVLLTVLLLFELFCKLNLPVVATCFSSSDNTFKLLFCLTTFLCEKQHFYIKVGKQIGIKRRKHSKIKN